MSNAFNAHLSTERGLTLDAKFRTLASGNHYIALSFNVEDCIGYSEACWWISSEQLDTVATGLEKLAAEVRRAANERAFKPVEQRPPLSAFAQQLVRVASEGIGSGLPDDVEQRR